MSPQVEPFVEDTAEEWDDFVATRARNGTLLHTRGFFRHNPANAGDDASLVFRDRGRIVAVAPAALRAGPDGARVWHSHPRATYGGFVVGADVGLADTLAIVDGAVEHARSLGASSMIVRNPFRIFHSAPADESDYAMWLRGFTIASRELEVAVPLDGVVPGRAAERYDGKTRNQLRKAQKLGVTVSEEDAYAEFWAMLEENLRARHGTRPTHALEDFERLRALVPAGAVRLFAARHEGRMVAGAAVFVTNARAAHVQYIASDVEARALNPVNALIDHLVEWAAAAGFAHLNLGMSTEDAGRRANLGLFAFKEGFGGRSVLRETMQLTLRDTGTDS